MTTCPACFKSSLIRTIVLTVLVCGGLLACGHSDGDHNEDNDGVGTGQSGPIQTPAIASIVTIDPAVPTATVKSISKIVSTFGQGTPGSSIKILSSPGQGDSVVFATDTEGNLLLAARTSEPTTTLSVDSTAVALVRIAFGALPVEITASQMNGDIRATAAFGPLSSSIHTAIAQPRSPADDPEVVSHIGEVLAQLRPVLTSRLSASAAPSGSAQLAKVQFYPSVTSQFPYSLTSAGLDRVEMTNANYLVSNKSLVAHSLIVSAPPLEIVLAETSAIDRITGDLTTVQLSNNSGQGFNITVGQSEASKRRNVLAIGSAVLAMLSAEIAGENRDAKCFQAKAGTFLLPKDIDPVVRDPSVATFETYLINVSTIANLHSILKECANLSDPTEIIDLTVKILIGVSSGFFEAKATAEGLGLMFQFVQFKAALARGPITNGVCESNDGNRVAIVNCATTLKFDPTPQMIVGQTTTPRVVALDIGNKPTATPANLQFSSLTPDIATVDATLGTITASKEGTAKIRITDPSTEISGVEFISVGPAVTILPGFFSGTVRVTDCTPKFCPSITYTGNSNSQNISFRTGSETHNFRIDQDFGCIGASAVISPAAGTSFSYSLSSGPPFADAPYASTHTFTVNKATADRLEGTFVLTGVTATPDGPLSGTTRGTWFANKRKPFAKCLPPTKNDGLNVTQSFFCPNFGDFGCNYIPLGGGARQGEWVE